jgi:phosphatidate cytidylyltransferase
LIGGFILSMFASIVAEKNRFILESIPSLYISGAILSTLYMYNRFGIIVLAFLFVITVATDTCAYFVGCHFRGRKLAPTISPNKSVSGAIGGVAGAFIFSCLYLLILFIFGKADVVSHLHLFGLIAITLSILSQCGDLFESYCKRINDVKDSSNLIRGHGGLLDRFDSFIAIVPIYVIMIVLSQSLL